MRPFLPIPVLLLAGMSVGCGGLAPETPLPPRKETAAFYGTGRQQTDRRTLEPVFFERGSWRIAPGEEPKVEKAAQVLKNGRRAILAGFGDGDVPLEHSRMQGEARAQSVRRLLLQQGVANETMQTVGFGADAAALAEAEPGPPRVEFGLVK